LKPLLLPVVAAVEAGTGPVVVVVVVCCATQTSL